MSAVLGVSPLHPVQRVLQVEALSAELGAARQAMQQLEARRVGVKGWVIKIGAPPKMVVAGKYFTVLLIAV